MGEVCTGEDSPDKLRQTVFFDRCEVWVEGVEGTI